MSIDTLYAQPRPQLDKFKFDEQVAAVFNDMIERSVPGYNTIVPMTGLIARHYAQQGSRLYDLGCSLGAVTLAMQQQLPSADYHIIAVDNAEAMISRCLQYFEHIPARCVVEIVCADIREIAIIEASVVVLNFTLQFIAPADRLALLRRIYDGMRPGGVLVLSEKITFTEPDLADSFVDLHHAFKQGNGYSALEINQKRNALEQVLIPDTLAEHQRRLQNAGFSQSALWFQCFNFASLLAWKN
jgi:tRNA (cmo5U34)-methyltransferase